MGRKVAAALAGLALLSAALLVMRAVVGVDPFRFARQVALARQMLGETYVDPISGNVMPYRLFIPQTSIKSRAPIVLVLHGGHGRAEDNLRQLDETVGYLLSDSLQGIEPTFVLAPQAARRTHWVNYPSFDPPFTNFDQREIPQSENIKTAIRILKRIIERYGIDAKRVYITGFSMGGEGTWDALTYYPELFTAAVVVAGAGDPRVMGRVSDIPIRFFHGSLDGITPVRNSRELDRALREVGSAAEYTEMEGAGHDVRASVYSRSLFEWLLQHRKP